MLVKKIIFIVILLILALAVLFKMEIKPEPKDVITEVKPSVASTPSAPAATNINLPSQ